MRAIVVYESMYGNTHTIANAIADGLRSEGDVAVLPAAEATQAMLEEVDLVVVGGPTHAHGMSRPQTRQSAIDDAHKPNSELTLDPDAEGEGLREWFTTLRDVGTVGVAFDTRVDFAAVLSGRASKGITKRLRHHGFTVLTEPESFLVDTDNHLLAGEEARAEQWGVALATQRVGQPA